MSEVKRCINCKHYDFHNRVGWCKLLNKDVTDMALFSACEKWEKV